MDKQWLSSGMRTTWQAIAVFLLLTGGFYSSLRSAEYPIYDPQFADETFLPVYLPADPSAAVTLIHRWNALSAVLPSPPAGKASWTVPRLAQAFGADGRTGRDADRDPAIAAWAARWAAWHGRRDAVDSQQLQFGLLQAPGVLLLPVPGEHHRQRLQTFIDHSWLADGHAAPPRWQESRASQTSTMANQGLVAAGSVLVLVVVVLGGWLMSRRQGRASTQPPAAEQ